MSGFNDAFEIVIGHEGGYTRNPKDRGNWTGCAIRAARLAVLSKGGGA